MCIRDSAWILRLFAPMPGAAAVMGAIGGDLTSVLPVHGVAGAGTYEAGVVAALTPFDIPTAAALAAAVNLHPVSYTHLWVTLPSFAVCLLKVAIALSLRIETCLLYTSRCV